MIHSKPKGIIGLVVGKLPPPGRMKREYGSRGDDVEEESDDDENMGLESAMGDLISAIKSGDATEAAAAFRDAHEICAGYDKE